MNVCVIPARGGSKRIPRKNVRDFCGKPMIAWSIATALRCKNIDRIIVSTDDEEIATVAQAAGAEVPFRRPAELADDHTATLPVVAHAIDWLRGHDCKFVHVCCVYPTAPFLHAADLDEGFRAVVEAGADYSFACATYPFPIQRALRLRADGRIEPYFPESIGARSQDLPIAMHDAGQCYWGLAEAFAQSRPIFGLNSIPVKIPRYRVQDIDTLEDWQRAELMFAAIKENAG